MYNSRLSIYKSGRVKGIAYQTMNIKLYGDLSSLATSARFWKVFETASEYE